MSEIKIVTHDRVFHADEVFAAAILRLRYKEVKIIRTRDPYLLSFHRGQKDTFMLDVGGIYDPEQRLFDHHQPEGAGFRDDAQVWPYATAGLVWKYCGSDVVRDMLPALTEADIVEVAHYIDNFVLRFLDATDCGKKLKFSGPSLSALVSSFNPAWYEMDRVDSFPLVVDLAQVMLSNFIKKYAGKVLSRETVRKSQTLDCGVIMVLEACLPWSSVLADEMPDVLLVIYPVDTGQSVEWQMRAAAHSDGTPRIRLPQAWAGLEGLDLARVCKEPEAVFAHRSRHLAGARTQDAMLRLARKTLEADCWEKDVALKLAA